MTTTTPILPIATDPAFMFIIVQGSDAGGWRYVTTTGVTGADAFRRLIRRLRSGERDPREAVGGDSAAEYRLVPIDGSFRLENVPGFRNGY